MRPGRPQSCERKEAHDETLILESTVLSHCRPQHCNRRKFLALTGTVSVLGPLSGARVDIGGSTREKIRSGKFGAAVQARQVLVDRGFRAAVLADCNSITPEIEFKWSSVEDTQGSFDLKGAEQLVNFGRAYNLGIHGHALLWHKSVPGWMFELLAENGRDAWTFIERYFRRLMMPFGMAVHSWDVVNEPIEVGSGPDGLRQQPFLHSLGPGYVARAFRLARSYAPEARLYLNEYGLVYGDPGSIQKRALMLRLLENLRKGDVPVDGVGIQAHLNVTGMSSFDQRSFAVFLDELAQLGALFRISELDVREDKTNIPVEQRDSLVAEATRQVLDVALAAPNLADVTCWGLSDRYSWLPVQSEAAGLNRGLPLDSDLRGKPMYSVLVGELSR